jgi:hypothetical protein
LNVNRQLDANQVMTDVVGSYIYVDLRGGHVFTPKGTGVKEEDLSDKNLENLLKAAKQHPTIAASLDTVASNKIVANHGYGVLGFDSKKVHLRNPHGTSDSLLSIPLSDLKKNFAAVLQATS